MVQLTKQEIKNTTQYKQNIRTANHAKAAFDAFKVFSGKDLTSSVQASIEYKRKVFEPKGFAERYAKFANISKSEAIDRTIEFMKTGVTTFSKDGMHQPFSGKKPKAVIGKITYPNFTKIKEGSFDKQKAHDSIAKWAQYVKSNYNGNPPLLLPIISDYIKNRSPSEQKFIKQEIIKSLNGFPVIFFGDGKDLTIDTNNHQILSTDIISTALTLNKKGITPTISLNGCANYKSIKNANVNYGNGVFSIDRGTKATEENLAKNTPDIFLLDREIRLKYINESLQDGAITKKQEEDLIEIRNQTLKDINNHKRDYNENNNYNSYAVSRFSNNGLAGLNNGNTQSRFSQFSGNNGKSRVEKTETEEVSFFQKIANFFKELFGNKVSDAGKNNYDKSTKSPEEETKWANYVKEKKELRKTGGKEYREM